MFNRAVFKIICFYYSVLSLLTGFIALSMKFSPPVTKTYITLLYAMPNILHDISFVLSSRPFYDFSIPVFSICSQIASLVHSPCQGF